MSHALRNRVIILALLLLAGQLSLVVHATVHDAGFSCQLCLSQSHHTKGIPTVSLDIPSCVDHDELVVLFVDNPPLTSLPRAYSQRAPPVVS